VSSSPATPPAAPSQPGSEAAASSATPACDPLDALWARVLASWDDDRTHGAFLEHAVRTERLAEAAACYRPLRDDPEKGERARKRLEAIATTAMHLLLATKTAAPRRPRRGLTLAAFVVCVALLVWLAMAVLRN
jgi:hypothetical protein